MHLTLDDVHEILRLLDQSPYDEMKLETDRFSVSFRRTADNNWTQETLTAPRSDEPAVPDATPQASVAENPEAKAAEADAQPIHAPLPGTFYRAPKPGAEPFVAVGSSVKDDTVIAIIETMKLMNSIAANCRGDVIEICVENAQMVDTGDILMYVRPDGK